LEDGLDESYKGGKETSQRAKMVIMGELVNMLGIRDPLVENKCSRKIQQNTYLVPKVYLGNESWCSHGAQRLALLLVNQM